MTKKVYEGIRFSVSRMGLQFNKEQEDKYSENIYSEWLRVQDKKGLVNGS